MKQRFVLSELEEVLNEDAPMTLWSCVLYVIANIIGMGLHWYYHRQKALEERRREASYIEKQGGGRGSPQSLYNSVSLSPVNLFRRQTRRSPSQSSLLSLLGLTYNGYSTFYAFEDRFSDFSEVGAACRRAGLETCGLIVGVDFSASNEWQGRKTFNGQNLHRVVPGKLINPYQKVLSTIARTIENLDEDNLIPAYGFGDNYTEGNSVFSFKEDPDGREVPCRGFSELLLQYSDIASQITLGGPTNFAPIIYKAIDIVKKLKRYHILIIIADGQVTESTDTVQAIVEASSYPLSIIMVGVGDGPWDIMEEFDNCLPERSFDNFQFVNYHAIVKTAKKNPEATFALHALMEIPDQYKTIKSLGYLSQDSLNTSTDPVALESPQHDDVSSPYKTTTTSRRTVLSYSTSKYALKHSHMRKTVNPSEEEDHPIVLAPVIKKGLWKGKKAQTS